MNKRKKTYLCMSILLFLVLLVAINFNKIKFMANMIGDYMNSGSDMGANINSNSDIGEIKNPLNEVNESQNNKGKQTNKDDSNYVEVISKYNSEFEMLKSDFEAKLDSLVQVGFKEYSSGDISTSKLANKYITEGTRLEEEVDRNFNILLDKLKEELDSNDHSTDITKNLKAHYRDYKSSIKAQYMEQIKNHL